MELDHPIPVELRLSNALKEMKGQPSSAEVMTEVALLAFNWGTKIHWYCKYTRKHLYGDYYVRSRTCESPFRTVENKDPAIQKMKVLLKSLKMKIELGADKVILKA